MTVFVSMLRGVNLAQHRRMTMKELRAVYESIGLHDVQTHLQSGNVVFRAEEKNAARLAHRIEDAIEKKFGFRSDIILRTPAELHDAIARNPFAARRGIEPNRLLVTFLATDPGEEAREQVRKIKSHPEELRIDGRELYIYYPNGMARPKVAWAALERILKTSGTGRNWNTVTKLLEIAEALGAAK